MRSQLTVSVSIATSLPLALNSGAAYLLGQALKKFQRIFSFPRSSWRMTEPFLRWIAPLIRGEVPGSECWEVPSPTGRRRPPNRLYIIWDERYVVWLEPREKVGWKFSSAYEKTSGTIRDYCRGGGKIWTGKKAPRD